MKSSIYLNRDDLRTIQQFMDAFPGSETLEITSDTSSGIGAIMHAILHAIDVNGHRVNVTKQIVDESSW